MKQGAGVLVSLIACCASGCGPSEPADGTELADGTEPANSTEPADAGAAGALEAGVESGLELPHCPHARRLWDEPPAGREWADVRCAELVIDEAGAIEAEGVVLFVPGEAPTYGGEAHASLDPWLADWFDGAHRDPLTRRVRVRADRRVEFGLLQVVMRSCTKDAVRARHIQLVVARGELGREEGCFDVFLPVSVEDSVLQLDEQHVAGTYKSPFFWLRLTQSASTDDGAEPTTTYMMGALDSSLEKCVSIISLRLAVADPSARHLVLDVRRPVQWGTVAEVLDQLVAAGVDDYGVWYQELYD